MTINVLAARAVAGSGHRSKKTEAFNALEPTIVEALSRGSSILSLYRELKKDGHDIGSETWFRKLVKQMKMTVSGEKPDASASPKAAVIMPLAAGPEPRAFGDARFSSDY